MYIFKTVAKMNHNVQISLNETLKDAQTNNYIGASTKIEKMPKLACTKGFKLFILFNFSIYISQLIFFVI